MTLPQAHFHLEVWILVPPEVRNTFPLNFGPEEQEMEDSIGLPVVNGFLMWNLAIFKDTMNTDCSDL